MPGYKTALLEKFEPQIMSGEIKRILDLGSGLSQNFIKLLEKYPDIEYTGVEPSSAHAEQAREKLSKFKNAEVFNADGYSPAGEKWGMYDLVISLSVLEHVKQLDKFLANSVDAARPGGTVVHSWDLGHALYPSSFKERLQVWLGNNVPWLLPEHKFVRMLGPRGVEQKLAQMGTQVEKISYHQMPSHKRFIQSIGEIAHPELVSKAEELVEWEFNASPYLEKIPEEKRLKLFPTVCIWSRKK